MNRALALLMLGACTQPGALVVVTVGARGTVSTATLTGVATLGTRSKSFTLNVPGGAIPPELVFGIELGPDARGSLDVKLTAAGSLTVEHAVDVVPHGRADLRLTFDNGQDDAGAPDGSSDDGAMIVDLFDTDGLPRTSRKYVVTRFALPQSRQDYSYDLNGDGRTDNQYGNVEGAMLANGFGVATDLGQISSSQVALNDEVRTGRYLLLLEHQSTDPAFTNDPFARVLVRRALNTVNPVLDGTGAFAVNPQQPTVRFDGEVSASKMSSRATATATSSTMLPLRLGVAGVTFEVVLDGSHIEYVITPAGLMIGRIHGAVRKATWDALAVPAIASGLNTQIQPMDAHAMQILQIFDLGDAYGQCDGLPPRDFAGLDGPTCFCAVKDDKYIDNCEVSQNSIIKNVMTADVDLFDEAGNFAPNPNNATKDSISVGIEFVAVPALF